MKSFLWAFPSLARVRLSAVSAAQDAAPILNANIIDNGSTVLT
ncbi:hypothetical protein [Mucilaginibacter ginkgonis]|nr:hypothetical protein [Mucilaginibacter ginkgonis]